MVKKIALMAAISAASTISLNSVAFAESPSESTITQQEIKQQIRANKKKIRKLKKALKAEHDERLEKALALAKKNNWVLRQQRDDGRLIELVDLDPFDRPVYYSTYNTAAADTISTDEVWANGNAMLNLSGKGMTVGVWDGGAVRTSHVEFNQALITDEEGNTALEDTAPRVIQKDARRKQKLDDHATHVAGTIAAGGVKNKARGMANQATVHAYDWRNDSSEMLAEAENGLLVSNHSYGQLAGWNYCDDEWHWFGNDKMSTEEDYLFGWYGRKSAAWDDIAETAPHYLIVKAAGNDRGEGPSELEEGQAPRDCELDGFDCITSQDIAKNILTVGAVRDIPSGYSRPEDVILASFSSFGPADDGRIKPDIVANGVSVLSTGRRDDDDYWRSSGTSMSAPSVTGSLILLQEHYQNINDYPMLAATLKGLVIHTASEAGNSEGPDYRFGWGLMNTEAAANVITEAARNPETSQTSGSLIAELSAFKGEVLTMDLVAQDADKPLTATIVWSDPKAKPFLLARHVFDNPTPRLINDLDMVLVETTAEGEKKYQPYVMNLNKPNDAATRGDNDVDNIEKIVIAKPTAGSTYQLRVAFDDDHARKHTVESFSLIASNVATPSCWAPRDVEVNESRTGRRKIFVTWEAPQATDGDVYISYRVAGAKKWKEKRANQADNGFRIGQLQAGTDYEIRARFECGGETNLYSTVVTETTEAALPIEESSS